MFRKRTGGCDWCRVGIGEDDGYRLLRPARDMGAAFCRLEHVVPWLIKKNDWHIWQGLEVPDEVDPHCAFTGDELGEDALYLVHHRGEYRIADGFRDRDALLAWAKAGGRYA